MSIEKEIKNRIQKSVKLTALGNDNRSMKDVAIDLIKASDMRYKEVAEGCYLCPSTVKNLATEKTVHPRYDTIERVFRFFEFQIDLTGVTLKAQFANREKGAPKKRAR